MKLEFADGTSHLSRSLMTPICLASIIISSFENLVTNVNTVGQNELLILQSLIIGDAMIIEFPRNR